MTHPYLTLVGTPQLPLRFAAVFLSALTLGMMSLTVVLCVRGWTGSFAVAGLASGLFSAGNAAGISVQGHLLTRYGGRRVIGAAALVFAAAIAAFIIAGHTGRTPVVLVAAGVAGLAVPAVTAAVRAWLPTALTAQRDRTASYALLSLTFQAAFAAGPLLVSACVVLLGPPLAAAVAAVLVAGAAAAYARTSPGPTPTPAPAPRPARTALHRGLLIVLAVAGMTGLAYGSLLVLVPTVMTSRGAPALAGVALAAIAVGEAAGALVYGSRRWRGPRTRHLFWTLAASGLACAAAALAAPSTVLLVLVLLGYGAAAGPVAIVLSALLDDIASVADVVRAYSLMVSTTLVAIAAGSAVTGLLVELADPEPLFVIPAALSALAALWTATQGSTLEQATPRGSS